MKKFTIDRTTWLRGGGWSYLLREPDGMMCCLGQIINQCGVSKSEISGKETPILVTPHEYKFFTFLVDEDKDENSILSRQAMEINDDGAILDPEREEKLKYLFSQFDIELEFIN